MLRPLCPMVSDRSFFIFGCQRSGTTMLLAILNAHPQITGIDESEFRSPYPFPSGPRLITNKLLNRYSGYKILEHSNKLEFLKKYYPYSKILWIVRNPFSTISSMKKLIWQDKNWIQRCVTLELERLKPFFNNLKDINYSQLSEAELGATYWYYKNQFPELLIKHEFKFFTLKYEDLLADPSKILKEVINFLELEWNPKLLKFNEYNIKKTLAGGTRTDRPLNSARANDFQGLDEKEITEINSICEPLIHKYGYTELINNQISA